MKKKKKNIVSRFSRSSPTRSPERVRQGENPGNKVEERPWKLDWFWTCYWCSKCIKRANTFSSTSFHSLRKP